MSSLDDKDSEKNAGAKTYVADVEIDNRAENHRVHLKDIDEVAELVAGFDREITEEEVKRIRRKIDYRLLPCM